MPAFIVNASAGEVGAHLPVNKGDDAVVVRFDAGARWPRADVTNRGAGGLWYSVDGSPPEVEGRRCFYLPPQTTNTHDVFGGGSIAMLADADTKVSVQRAS